MFSLITGNLFSLFAMAADSISSSRKTTRDVLLVQSVGQFFYCLSAIFLKGYSAAVQNVISILRNFVALRAHRSKYLEWFLVALGVLLGLVFNNRGWLGLLPIAANLEYSIAVFHFKDNERALKTAFLFCIVLFAAFNVVILNIVGLISNAIVFIMTLLFVLRSAKR